MTSNPTYYVFKIVKDQMCRSLNPRSLRRVSLKVSGSSVERISIRIQYLVFSQGILFKKKKQKTTHPLTSKEASLQPYL
jgi:hypothetical protein